MCEWCREDVEHLLVMMCGEFERDQWVMADEVKELSGLEEYGRVCKVGDVTSVGKRCGGSKGL